MYSNANSLIGKMSELKQRSKGSDIIGITETWARNEVGDDEFALEGFTLFRQDQNHHYV